MRATELLDEEGDEAPTRAAAHQRARRRPTARLDTEALTIADRTVPLAVYGVSVDRDAQVAKAEAVLATRGHTDLVVVSLRWGTLTLSGPPAAAQAVRIDGAQILAALAAGDNGAPFELRVQVRGAIAPNADTGTLAP